MLAQPVAVRAHNPERVRLVDHQQNLVAVAKLDIKKPVALLVRDENGTRFVTFRTDEG